MGIPDYIEESIEWAENCVKGKKLGASTKHIENLLELVKILLEKESKIIKDDV